MDALLFSSEIVFLKSMEETRKDIDDLDMNLNYSISKRGIDELNKLERNLGLRKIAGGVFDAGKCYFMIVPMKESENVKTTVGLGDTISSIGFIGDLI